MRGKNYGLSISIILQGAQAGFEMIWKQARLQGETEGGSPPTSYRKKS